MLQQTALTDKLGLRLLRETEAMLVTLRMMKTSLSSTKLSSSPSTTRTIQPWTSLRRLLTILTMITILKTKIHPRVKMHDQRRIIKAPDIYRSTLISINKVYYKHLSTLYNNYMGIYNNSIR